MHTKFLPMAVAALALTLTCSSFATAERASKDEAVAMVKKAVAHYKSAGREQALTDFSAKSGGFVDRDLYIFASDFSGRILAHGANPKLIGRDLIGLKDADGKAFIAEYTERVKAGKAGWTDYKWANPVTKEVDAKATYCEPVDGLAVCGGVYK